MEEVVTCGTIRVLTACCLRLLVLKFVYSSTTLVNTEIFVVVIVRHLFKIMQNEKKKKRRNILKLT